MEEREIKFILNSHDNSRYDLLSIESGNVVAVIHGDDLSDMGCDCWIKEPNDNPDHYALEIKAKIIFENPK